MTVERERRAAEIFEETIDLDETARAQHVTDACGHDDALRAEVESLLAAHARSGDFLQSSLSLELDEIAGTDPEVGRVVGAYHLDRRIGSGGMGRVYLAHRSDGSFTKDVAIKLIRRGLDTEDVLARFRTERQVLAHLEHPNIARLLDGGSTDDGQPFLVMEYVDGVRIDDYCRDHDLSIDARIDLYLTVCDAVECAHRNLVVHRDLKPSNILVDGGGQVKLLDFGVAKVLDADASVDGSNDQTAAHRRRLTPAYASPELIAGGPVTTAADVYALGVVLYELLCDRRPFTQDSPSPTDLERAMDAEPPSRHDRRLAGDLENIILMALRREAERRYASVTALAEDIRRHRTGLPVRARADTLAYRASRFLLRHAIGVTAAAIVMIALLVATILSTTALKNEQAARERSEADRGLAERRFGQVRSLANTVMFELYDEIETLAGATAARESLVVTGLEYLDALSAEAGGDETLLAEIARGYGRLGEVQGRWNIGNVGDTSAAMASFGRQLEIAERLSSHAPDRVEYRIAVASAHRGVGDMHLVQGRVPEALEAYRLQLGIVESCLLETPDDDGLLRRLMLSQNTIGDALARAGRPEEAIPHFEQALESCERRAAAHPRSLEVQRDLRIAIQRMGMMAFRQNDLVGAEPHLVRASTLARQLATTHPDNAQLAGDQSVALDTLGVVLLQLDETDRAVEAFEESLGIQRGLYEADPANRLYGRRFAIASLRVGDVATSRADHETAYESYALAAARMQDNWEADPDNARNLADMIEVRGMAHHALVELRRLAEAIAGYDEDIELAETLVELDDTNFAHASTLMNASRGLAEAHRLDGNRIATLATLEKYAELVGRMSEIMPDGHQGAEQEQSRIGYEYGVAFEHFGEDADRTIEERRVDLETARSWFEDARDRTTVIAERTSNPQVLDVLAKLEEDIARVDARLANTPFRP